MSVQYKGKKRKVKRSKDGGVHLNLYDRKITDISQIEGLEQLTDLTSLDLSYNNITEIKGLESLKNLKSLSLDSNQISEIKGLDNLKNLSQLTLMENNIRELKGLQNIEDLQYFVVYRNPLDDWMKKNFGRGPYGQSVVEYCRKMEEGENYDYSRVEKLLDQAKKEIENIIKTTSPGSSKKKFMKTCDTIGWLLRETFKKVYDRTIFYDFLGNLITQYLGFFDARFSDAYNSRIADKVYQKCEMESYILEKFCFFEGEFFISKFYGVISHGNFILKGRIYATNYRIIGHGAYSRKRSDAFEELLKDIPNIARFSYSTSKPIFEDIEKFSGKDLKYRDLPIFGYQYPILNTRKASLAKVHLKLRSDRNYEIEIIKSSDETKAGFIERTQAILNPIYNYLMEKQIWTTKR